MPTWRRLPVPIIAALVIGFLLTVVYKDIAYPGARIDILQHYAANLRAGNGLVFNPGEPTLLLFSPLYMALFTYISTKIIFIAALILAAGSVMIIAERAELSYRDSLLAVFLTLL